MVFHMYCREGLESQLSDIKSKLSEARADQVESDNEKKKRDVINQLIQTFSGVYGRLTELVKVFSYSLLL